MTMTEVAKTFLHCLNHWNFEAPSVRNDLSYEDASAYKINYTRWLMFCHVPAFCSSLKHFDTSIVFGRSLLKAVYQYISQQLLTKCKNEKERMPPEKRSVLAQLPRFLEALKHEVVDEESLIWDISFKPVSLLLQRKRHNEITAPSSSTKKGKKMDIFFCFTIQITGTLLPSRIKSFKKFTVLKLLKSYRQFS